MPKFLMSLAVLLTSLQTSIHAQDPDYGKAIAYGQSFKSRLQYLDKGLKDQKIQLASSFAKDGMSKYVTLFTDYEIIASAAAQAHQEMKGFTAEDAKKLPLSGLVLAHVEVKSRGSLTMKKLNKRYVKNQAHLVLEIDGHIHQPIKKNLSAISEVRVNPTVSVLDYWDTKQVSLLTGGSLEAMDSGNGWTGANYSAKVEMEFAFQLDPSARAKKGRIILIDADGNKHQEDVDFGKILR